MKRYIKKNILNIIFVLLILTIMGLASTWELEGEIETGAATTQPGTVEADEKTVDAIEPVAYKEPVEPTVETLIVQGCKDYGIDYNLALTISRLETGHWTSPAYLEGNNPGGLKEAVAGGYETIAFNSLTEGVSSFIRTLANIGTSDINELAKIYCPDNPNGWAEKVEALM